MVVSSVHRTVSGWSETWWGLRWSYSCWNEITHFFCLKLSLLKIHESTHWFQLDHEHLIKIPCASPYLANEAKSHFSMLSYIMSEVLDRGVYKRWFQCEIDRRKTSLLCCWMHTWSILGSCFSLQSSIGFDCSTALLQVVAPKVNSEMFCFFYSGFTL